MAHESQPVQPVPAVLVDITMPFLPPVVADMVRFQRLTGCRPGEVCLLRPCDLDRSGDVWAYRPESHKTEHHGREARNFRRPSRGKGCFVPICCVTPRPTASFLPKVNASGWSNDTRRQDACGLRQPTWEQSKTLLAKAAGRRAVR